MLNHQDPMRAKLTLDYPQFFDEVLHMLSLGRKVKLRAKGWSMLPLIWSDRDNLILSPLTPDSYQVGRIVFVQLGDRRYVVHRIAEIKEDRFTLRGDGNPYQYEYCHRDQVRAELIAIERAGKRLDVGTLWWRIFAVCWPSNGFLRRCLLFAYRRLCLYPLRPDARPREHKR